MGSIKPVQPVESEAEALERDAFNAAFRELGLRWHWDVQTFRSLETGTDDAGRVRTYLERREAHLLKAYDAGFLVEAVLAAKEDAKPRVAHLVGARAARCADCAEYPGAQTGF